MTLTTLDPRTALVVLDLQNAIAGLPAVHPVADVIGNAIALTDAFRAKGLPVVIVTVAGGAPGRTERSVGGGRSRLDGLPANAMDLVDGIDADGAIRVVKRTWGGFTGTDLHEKLQAEGVTQLVLTGISTSKAVEGTARAAYELGYNVTLPIDAMTDSDLATHENSTQRIFPALGETGTTAEVIALLDAPTATPTATAAASTDGESQAN